MVSVYPIRGMLYISWTERDSYTGKTVRVTRSLRIKDTAANRKIAKEEKKAKLRELEINPIVRRYQYRLDEAVEDFLKTKAGVNHTSFKITLDYLIDVYGGHIFVRDIKTLTPLYDFLLAKGNNNIKEEKNKRNISLNTVASYMRNTKIFFNWLFDRKFISAKPEMPKYKKIRTRRRPCPIYIITGVLDYLKQKEDKDQYLAILILFLTGIRAGELCRLRWEDIDFENGIIYIENTKGREENQMFPLYPTAKRMLEPLRKQSGKVITYTRSDSLRFWNRALKHLKFEHHSIHSIRKAFGTQLGRVSAPRKVIQELLRHKDYKTSDDSYIFAELQEMSQFAETAIGGQLKDAV